MSDKFEFIDVEYAAYQESDEQYVPSIVKMCTWMEVSRSGFYEWRSTPESAIAKRRGELALYVRKSFEDSGDTYGYRRVHTDLVAWGVPAGPELVRSLMRELGLEACQQAIEMAARNCSLAEGAVFHSDRGSNYTSREFAGTLKMHNLRQSVGRTGTCYDNAMAESFFAALKNECVYRTQYPTREHARRDVVRYIEFWYN